MNHKLNAKKITEIANQLESMRDGNYVSMEEENNILKTLRYMAKEHLAETPVPKNRYIGSACLVVKDTRFGELLERMNAHRGSYFTPWLVRKWANCENDLQHESVADLIMEYDEHVTKRTIVNANQD